MLYIYVDTPKISICQNQRFRGISVKYTLESLQIHATDWRNLMELFPLFHKLYVHTYIGIWSSPKAFSYLHVSSWSWYYILQSEHHVISLFVFVSKLFSALIHSIEPKERMLGDRTCLVEIYYANIIYMTVIIRSIVTLVNFYTT